MPLARRDAAEHPRRVPGPFAETTNKPINLHFVDIVQVGDKVVHITSASSMELMPPPKTPTAKK